MQSIRLVYALHEERQSYTHAAKGLLMNEREVFAGAIALDQTWMFLLLPILLIGAAVVATWIGWKRDEDKFQPLPTAPAAGEEGHA